MIIKTEYCIVNTEKYNSFEIANKNKVMVLCAINEDNGQRICLSASHDIDILCEKLNKIFKAITNNDYIEFSPNNQAILIL